MENGWRMHWQEGRVCMYMWPLFVCLCVCRSVCLSICPSVYISVSTNVCVWCTCVCICTVCLCVCSATSVCLYPVGRVVVYGGSLAAYTAVEGLLKLGVSGRYITLVHPSAPVCFNNLSVEGRVALELEQAGMCMAFQFCIPIILSHTCVGTNGSH